MILWMERTTSNRLRVDDGQRTSSTFPFPSSITEESAWIAELARLSGFVTLDSTGHFHCSYAMPANWLRSRLSSALNSSSEGRTSLYLLAKICSFSRRTE